MAVRLPREGETLDWICFDLVQDNGKTTPTCHAIQDGIIVEERENPTSGNGVNLRGTGLLALPALIDMHVHLRGLRLSYKETVKSGTKAAARGGIGVVADMPNTRPKLNTPEAIASRLSEIREEAVVDVYLYAGIPETPELVKKLSKAPRIVGFKVYPEDLEKWEVVRELSNQGLLIVQHPELPLVNRETCPERLAVRSALRACHFESSAPLLLSSLENVRLHITHASCPSTITIARKVGATVDVTPHHLLYDYENPPNGSECLGKVNPPLRSIIDRSLIARNVLEGHVDALASDHAPHARLEKTEPLSCASGIPWLELWPWAILRLLRPLGRRTALSILLRLAYEAPRKILGLPRHAVLGGLASYTIIAPRRWRWTGFRHSKAVPHYHFMLELYGAPVATLVRGRPVYSAKAMRVER
jgi:dihydroorotase